MKTKIIVIQSGVILILFALVMLLVLNPHNIRDYIFQKNAKADQLFIEYGEDFAGFELTTYEGETIKELSKGKVSVVTYISDSCSSCMDSLSDFNRFKEVFGDTIDYSIIWTDSIPNRLIDKYEIDTEVNYSLSGKVRLSTSTPTFYILDENNRVIFKDVERINLIKKLVESGVVDNNEIRENATKYIAKEYYHIDDMDGFNNKLVYFYMPGCPDCARADALFKEHPLSEFEMLYIYKYNTVGDDMIIDKDKLFVSVYGITWYPSFLVAKNGKVKIVGEMPTEQIVDEIRQ